MRRARLNILSVLLFVFSFFIIHDYVMVDLDADTQSEICYWEHDKSVLDLPSQIHDHIHVLLAAPDIEKSVPPAISSAAETLSLQNTPGSITLSVPQRPPLA